MKAPIARINLNRVQLGGDDRALIQQFAETEDPETNEMYSAMRFLGMRTSETYYEELMEVVKKTNLKISDLRISVRLQKQGARIKVPATEERHHEQELAQVPPRP